MISASQDDLLRILVKNGNFELFFLAAAGGGSGGGGGGGKGGGGGGVAPITVGTDVFGKLSCLEFSFEPAWLMLLWEL